MNDTFIPLNDRSIYGGARFDPRMPSNPMIPAESLVPREFLLQGMGANTAVAGKWDQQTPVLYHNAYQNWTGSKVPDQQDMYGGSIGGLNPPPFFGFGAGNADPLKTNAAYVRQSILAENNGQTYYNAFTDGVRRS